MGILGNSLLHSHVLHQTLVSFSFCVKMLVKVARETLNLVTSLDSWHISSCYSIPELVRQRKTVLRTRGDASEFFGSTT
jgi:hypothetical protein